MSEMYQEKDDEIKTPDASRSNSIDESEDRFSSPPILRSNAEINRMESPSLNRGKQLV
jgi:hypothetical protein